MLLAPNQAPIAGAYIGVPGGPYREGRYFVKRLELAVFWHYMRIKKKLPKHKTGNFCLEYAIQIYSPIVCWYLIQ